MDFSRLKQNIINASKQVGCFQPNPVIKKKVLGWAEFLEQHEGSDPAQIIFSKILKELRINEEKFQKLTPTKKVSLFVNALSDKDYINTTDEEYEQLEKAAKAVVKMSI